MANAKDVLLWRVENGELSALKPLTTMDNVAGLEEALTDKVDKVSGKQLSTNDFTGAYRAKLDATNVAYGTCSTAATTAAKVINLISNGNWALTAGSRITVKFSATNTASNPTFNVNNTGAKKVWYNTAVITTSSLNYAGYANRPMDFVYDGTQYVFTGWSVDSNSTYSNASLGQGYGTCSTAASTTAKVVSLSSYALSNGGIVAVKFTNSVPASATMNINSKGAKAIYYKGAAITANVIKAGDVATFIYDGTQYHLLSVDRACSVATSSADGLMSQHDKQIFDAFGFYTSGNYAEMLTTKNISVQTPEITIDAEKPIGISTGGKYTTVSSAEIVDMKNEIGAKAAVTTLETSRNAIIKKGSAEGSTISGGVYNGINPAATAAGAHSEGGGTQAKSDGAHTEGVNTVAGRLSQADTTNTTKVAQIIAPAATELGMAFSTTAEQQAAVLKLGGFGAHAEGFNTQALGTAAHAEGNATRALANSTHAEGDTTIAFGEASHAEGYNTKAKGNQSHAEGLDTEANGNASHTEGRHTKTAASAAGAHAEGISTQANADGSHAAGIGTKATTAGQTVVGTYNDDRNDLFTVGCGTSDSDRKSAFGVNKAGNTYVQNRLYVHGGARFTDNGGTSPSVEFNTPVTFAKGITLTSTDEDRYVSFSVTDLYNMKAEVGAKEALSSHKHTVTHTPAGTVSQPTFTGSAVNSGAPSGTGATSTVASSSHTHKYTPAGTVSKPSFTGSEVTSGAPSSTTTVYSITDVGTLPSHSYTAPSHSYTAPSLTASVANRCLTLTFSAGTHTFNAGSHSFSAGTLPTKGSGVSVAKGDHTHKVTAAGSVSQPTFTGTEASTTSISGTTNVASEGHIHSVTAAGTVSKPTFSGTKAELTTSTAK